jgi:hypothetical protein
VKDENIGKSRIFLSPRKEAFTDHQKTPVADFSTQIVFA